MLKAKSGMTLMELLIAVSLLGVVLLGVSAVSLFSQLQVRNADREGRNKNEVAYIVEHMSKQIGRAIGNLAIANNNPIDLANIAGNPAVQVYIDDNPDGQDSRNGPPVPAGDFWIAYRLNGNQLQYCSRCANNPCAVCNTGWEPLGNNIIAPFNRNVTSNCLDVTLTACWDAANSATCGTSDNPSVTMRTNLIMPSVSSN